MSRGNLAWLLAVPALVLLGLVATLAAPEPDADYKLVRTISDVLGTVDRNYVRRLTDDEKRKLVEDMLNGGLMRLDRHSVYLNESQLEAFDTENDGEFVGVGVQMAVEPDGAPEFLTVATPMPNSPAYDAGIQAGDKILAVDGTPTKGMTTAAARKIITGKPGTPVTLRVRRGGGTRPPEDLILKRAKVEMPVIEGHTRLASDPTAWDHFPEKGTPVALVRLTGFNGKTHRDLKAALDAVAKAGAKALVFDLRDNPGGLLSEAVEVGDLFLAAGTIVSTKNRDEQGRTFTAKDDGSPYENAAAMPMAVLIDRGSASASEIVAAAIHDNRRGVLVGERTFGKGSVQKVFPLSDRKTAVKLTFEEWLTPAGKHIHRHEHMREANLEWGVFPGAGFEVPMPVEEFRKYAAYRRALDVMPGKPGTAPPPPPGPPMPTYADPVVARAVAHLKGQLK